MAEVFANPLVDLAEYTDMKQDLDQGKGPVQISGVTDSQKVHVMHELSKDNPWRLVVTYDDTRAKEIFDDFSYFEPNTWLYPARDLLFYSSDIHGNLLTRQRMQVFKHLLEDEGGVVVTTVDGLMDHLLPLSMIKESCLNIMVGQTLDMEEIKHLLTGMGYERMGQVDGMGQFSVRGGILDVFPLTEEVPVRIELWGDEVDSIRSFDAESQRSIQQMDEVTIYPAAELTLTKEQMENGTDRIEKEGKKQEKRRALLDAAYELFLERGTAKTSVEDITSRAKVAKGTFYLYFQDKGAVMQALLGRVSYQLLNNACEAVERQTGLETFPDKMVAVIDHIIEALRRDTVVLKFLERNFVWPGLDQIEASRDAEPLMRKLLNVVLTSPEMAGRTEREVYQRITALGSMCMSVCYSSILEGKPDNIDSMKPVLYDIIRKAL